MSTAEVNRLEVLKTMNDFRAETMCPNCRSVRIVTREHLANDECACFNSSNVKELPPIEHLGRYCSTCGHWWPERTVPQSIEMALAGVTVNQAPALSFEEVEEPPLEIDVWSFPTVKERDAENWPPVGTLLIGQYTSLIDGSWVDELFCAQVLEQPKRRNGSGRLCIERGQDYAGTIVCSLSSAASVATARARGGLLASHNQGTQNGWEFWRVYAEGYGEPEDVARTYPELLEAIPKVLKVNPNTASEEELLRLPGFGPWLVGKLMRLRDKYPLTRKNIYSIHGIGAETRKKIERHLVFDD